MHATLVQFPAVCFIGTLATGLMHPRFVYPLPNGDILVVESNGPSQPRMRPKDLIMGPIQAYGGAAAKGGNRITLLRPAVGNAPAQLGGGWQCIRATLCADLGLILRLVKI